MNADHANTGRHAPSLAFAQTGRIIAETDWKFAAAIPKTIGEDTVRAWITYEYARESRQLREWARLIHTGAATRASAKQRRLSREYSDKIHGLFESLRDGWLGGLLVSFARHLYEDTAWEEIDANDRTECVRASISGFEAMHTLNGYIGEVRLREIGVRLASRTDRAAFYREEFFENMFKSRGKNSSQHPRKTEAFTFEVQWAGLRDDELKAAFSSWLKYLRPGECPEPARLARSAKSSPKALLTTVLLDLGIMRLTHTHSPWQAEDISGKDAPARTDARNRARANFRSIFPVLGENAVLRSDKLWTARQKFLPSGLA